MDDLPFQLVLQFPEKAVGVDQRFVMQIEDALEARLDVRHHCLDGHDQGSGTVNIFIDTDEPAAALESAKTCVPEALLGIMRAGYRAYEEDEYVLVWPKGSQDSFELM